VGVVKGLEGGGDQDKVKNFKSAKINFGKLKITAITISLTIKEARKSYKFE